jgi:hypothetical protein
MVNQLLNILPHLIYPQINRFDALIGQVPVPPRRMRRCSDCALIHKPALTHRRSAEQGRRS